MQLAENSSPLLRNMALDGLDQCISAVLGSDRFLGITPRHNLADHQVRTIFRKFNVPYLTKERESKSCSYYSYPPFFCRWKPLMQN